MSQIIFLDLETTGLPDRKGFDTYYDPKETKYYDKSRIVQIALIVYENGIEKILYNAIIKPDNFTIENSHIHGITTDIALKDGISFVEAFSEIKDDFKGSNLLVAHNLMFDKNVLLSELYRYGLVEEAKIIENIPRFCTLKNTTDLLKLPGKYGFKSPKLSELHYFLFGSVPEGLHNALIDTQVLVKCFWELHSRNLFHV